MSTCANTPTPFTRARSSNVRQHATITIPSMDPASLALVAVAATAVWILFVALAALAAILARIMQRLVRRRQRS